MTNELTAYSHTSLTIQNTLIPLVEVPLRRGKNTATEDIYVVKDLHTALLGRPAIEQLQLVCRVDSITMESVKQQYPKLCSGLGLVRRPYSIKLKPEAVPFSLHAPRRVPLPLMGKVKEEIDRMD